MLKTIQNALKIPDIRKKLIYTFMMLVVIRFGSQLPIPGVDPSFIRDFFERQQGDAFSFFNAMTGGSFTNMSIFALSITPYITSSIIIQLLTIAIPKLEEMQKEGEDGRKKIIEYTRYLTVVLALIQSTAMSVGFGSRGLLIGYNAQTGAGKAAMIVVAVAAMTAGSALLMWIGERITQNGIGNGISIVLLFNIISSIPEDANTLYTVFMRGRSVAIAVTAAIIIIALIVAIVVFVIILQDAERRIPVQYSKKMQGRRMVGGRSSHIPLKVNTAGVIPVIFASSIMSFPVVIAQFFHVDYSTIGGKILLMLNTSSWFKVEQPVYSIGLIVYVALIIIFAYFYTSITFNPLEVANDMKKQGGFIPGVRPGKPTSDYLNNLLNYLVFIGAVGLTIICIIPFMVSGLFNIGHLSFGGTSLIIIVSVTLETIKAVESQMLVRNYKGFLND
ncbi:preprotein translocase subunit SecY [Lachnospiraceae bacterium 62-35]